MQPPASDHIRALALVAALAGCVWALAVLYKLLVPGPAPIPPEPPPFLEAVPPDEAREILQNLAWDPDGLGKALESNVKHLERMDEGAEFPWAGGSVRAGELARTSRALLDLVRSARSEEEFALALADRFTLFRVTGNVAEPVLVTGYFQPEIPASPEPSEAFPYPLYSPPPDLLRVDLARFDPDLPSCTLWGRVEGGAMIPYFTRSEIDVEGRMTGAAVLAWIPSPVDGLMLHIQGSGLLRFPDGERRHVHVAATNGRPYGSLGAWLIKNGHLTREEADWPGISAWARSHPDLFREALASNPRYIFFEWAEKGPVGSMGEILVPLNSVAMDQAFYPLGSVAILGCDLPNGSKGGDGAMRPVCIQDTGAAIRGPHRLDLYCGEGEDAGRLAGTLRHNGAIYLILTRK